LHISTYSSPLPTSCQACHQTVIWRTWGRHRLKSAPIVAFDEAQIGEFKQARATLASAARQGVSPVLIGWVSNEIQYLQRQG
jgi:hypothetical protein